MEAFMNTINTNSLSSYYKPEQSLKNETIKTKETNQEVDDSVETKKEYDFKNITPHETYQLADQLYQSGQADVYQVATLMIIGFQQEFNAENKPLDTSNRDNDPFNLYDELNKKASNTDGDNFANPDTQKAAKSLIELLLEIEEESSSIEPNSVDITV